MSALNSSVFPSGRSCGQRWLVSFSVNIVTAVSAPPDAETRQILAPEVGVKTIVSSLSQLGAELATAKTSEIVTGMPPRRMTFFSLPLAKKPIHWPSGEKNGLSPPSVPGIGVLSNSSIPRRRSVGGFLARPRTPHGGHQGTWRAQ